MEKGCKVLKTTVYHPKRSNRGVDNILTLGRQTLRGYVGKLTLILGTTDTDPHVVHMYNR